MTAEKPKRGGFLPPISGSKLGFRSPIMSENMATTNDGFKVDQVTFREEVLDALKAFHQEVNDVAKFKKSV